MTRETSYASPPLGPELPTRHSPSPHITPMSPEAKPKPSLPKHLQSPLRPPPHRTTSSISTVSVEANQVDAEGRSLLSQDPKYVRSRTHSLHASVSPPLTHSEEESLKPAPVVQRTLSAPGTPGRAGVSRTASIYSLSVPAQSTSGSSGSSPSRKGKEKALDDFEVEDVDVEGELVTHSGDATKGLRALVRRSTIVDGPGQAGIGRDTSKSRPTSLYSESILWFRLNMLSADEIHTLDPPQGMSLQESTLVTFANLSLTNIYSKTVLRPHPCWETRIQPTGRYILRYNHQPHGRSSSPHINIRRRRR
jgi:hypothetical protein